MAITYLSSARENAETNMCHCVKSVRIRSYSGPYSVRMRENADQNNLNTDTFQTVCVEIIIIARQ